MSNQDMNTLDETQSGKSLSKSDESQPLRLEDLTPEVKAEKMLWLWGKMHDIFGQSWITQMGDIDGEAIKTWADSLGKLTGKQFANGVEQAKRWTGDFPPNLPQFSRMCLTTTKPTYTDRRIEGAKKAQSLGQLAAPKKGDSDLVRAEKEKMRIYLETGGGPLIEPTKEESRRTIAYYNSKQLGKKAGILHS